MSSDAPGEIPVLNEDRLQQLVRDLGAAAPQVLGQLLEIFTRDKPIRLEQLWTAAAEGELDSLSAAAHSIKSSSSNLGLTRLAAGASEAEEAARAGDLDAAMKAAAGVPARYDEAEEAFKEWLNARS